MGKRSKGRDGGNDRWGGVTMIIKPALCNLEGMMMLRYGPSVV